MGYLIDPEGHETHVLQSLCDFSNRDVVEVGCGDGRMTWRYASGARSVLGIDPDPVRIARALAATSEDVRPVVNFQVADIATVDLPSVAFDVAILSWSL